MLNTARKFRKSIMLLGKALLLAALSGILLLVWYFGYPDAIYYNLGNYVVSFLYVAVLLLFINIYNAFRIGVLRLWEIVYSLCLAVVISNSIAYLQFSLIARELVPLPPMGLATLLQMLVSLFGAWSLNRLYFQLYPARNVVVVCPLGEKSSEDVIRKLKQRKERYQVCDVVDASLDFTTITQRIGTYNSVMLCDIGPQLRTQLINYCFRRNKRVYITLGLEDILINNAHSTQLFDTPALYCKGTGPSTEQMLFKRMMDVLLSGIALILFSPFMLIIAISIKLCDGGPILFTQRRLTMGNREFSLYKFRSMVVDAEKAGAQLATKEDDRITPVGKIIRKLRMDELPQLVNIFIGDMSIVGPRPERPEMIQEYNIQDFDLRTRMKAGLTGYAQVHGKYNTSPEDKLKMDLIYLERYSLLLDIQLILMTIKILFIPESTEGVDS